MINGEGGANLLFGDAARSRLALGAEERLLNGGSSPVKIKSIFIHAPAEVLVEGRGSIEYILHNRYAVEPPVAEVLVE